MRMTNQDLVDYLIAGGVLKTPRFIAAFRAIDRRDFVPASLRQQAYDDIPLPIGFGQTISQPSTVAFMLEQFAPLPTEHLLDIGTGSGWQTALLAEVMNHPPSQQTRGHVTSVEVIPELAQLAAANLQPYGFVEKGTVTLMVGNAREVALPHPVYDGIIAAAAGYQIPAYWKELIRIGGRVVAPVQNTIQVLHKLDAQNFQEVTYPGFAFVPLV